jgi:hypothetical protein
MGEKLFGQPTTTSAQERHEQVAPAYDDPLWQEKDRELLKTKFGRRALTERRELTLRFGYCEAEHPLQGYVRSVADKHPALKQIRVFIAPGDRSQNAYALPDGTVFITPSLVCRTKTVEALLGVLLHEARHVTGEHAKHSVEKQGEVVTQARAEALGAATRASVEGVSLLRLHENIADMRGTIMGLDEAGFNPRGYIEFLQELALLEGKRGGDAAHGDTQERALKGIEMMAALHFTSAMEPLHALEPERMEWAQEKTGVHLWPTFQETLYDKKGEAAQELVRTRMEVMKHLPLCLVPQAISVTWREIHGKGVQAHLLAGKKMMHDRFFPVIQSGCRRLVEGALGPGVAEREQLGAQVAVGHVFTSGFPLPQKSQASVWAYIKADLSYMLFRDTGIQEFLGVVDRIADSDVEARTGLVRIDHNAVDSYLDWLLLKFPAIPTTPEAMDAWWALVGPMARDLCLRTGEKPDAFSFQFPSPVAAAEGLFQKWIVQVSFKVPPTSFAEQTVFTRQPSIVALQQAFFARPAAPIKEPTTPVLEKPAPALKEDNKFGEEVQLFSERLRVERSAHIAVKHTWLEYTAKEIYTEADVKRVLDECSKALQGIERRQDVLTRLHRIEQSGPEAFNQLVLYSLLRRVVLEHPAFAEDPLPLRKAALWSLFDDVYRLVATGHQHLLREASAWQGGGGDAELTLLGGAAKSAVVYISAESKAVMEDEVHLRDITPDNVFEAIRIFNEYAGAVAPAAYRATKANTRATARYLGQGLNACSTLKQGLAFIKDPRVEQLQRSRLAGFQFDGPWVERIARELGKGTIAKLPLEDQRRLGAFLQEASLKSAYADTIGGSAAFRALPMKAQVEHAIGTDGIGLPLATGKDTSDWLLEQRPLSKQDYQTGATALEEYGRRLETKGELSYGVYVLLDKVYNSFTLEDIVEFVRVSLQARKTDEPLKNFLLETIQRSPGEFGVDYMGKEGRATDVDFDNRIQGTSVAEKIERVEAKKRGDQVLGLANAIYEDLFRIPQGMRHIIASKVLGGARGLLRQPETRKKLFQVVRETWVDAEEGQTDLMKTIERVEGELAADEEWEAVYLGIVGVLRDQLFQRGPEQVSTPWEQTKEARALQVDAGAPLDYADLAIWKLPPASAKRAPWRYPLQWKRYAEDQCRKALAGKKKETSGEGMRVETETARTPIAFAAEVASHGSAVSVRAAQNLEEVVELTPEEQRDLSHVYDAVKGQARIAALMALEQRWPGLWEEYAEIGARIGGGSIFTVFRGRTHRAEERVIKVVNPNIQLHLERTGGLIKRTADRLATKYGGSYELIPGLIEDEQEWVRREAVFTGFLEKDRDFHASWNGFSEGGSGYQLRVPRSYGPEHELFVQEEYVAAKNLTHWDELAAEGHDLKAITRLLGISYVGQLLRGRALSDIHIGNEAVTKEREVVLFDRVLYLDLTSEEQTVLQTLFASPDQQVRANALEGYLTQLVGREMPGTVRKEIERSLERLDLASSHELLLALRRAKIRPPLNLILPLKNIRVLDSLSRRAGWKYGLIEAVNA